MGQWYQKQEFKGKRHVRIERSMLRSGCWSHFPAGYYSWCDIRPSPAAGSKWQTSSPSPMQAKLWTRPCHSFYTPPCGSTSPKPLRIPTREKWIPPHVEHVLQPSVPPASYLKALWNEKNLLLIKRWGTPARGCWPLRQKEELPGRGRC